MKTMQQIVLAAALFGLAGYSTQAVSIDTEIVRTPGNAYTHTHLILSLDSPDPDITKVQYFLDGLTDTGLISTTLSEFLKMVGLFQFVPLNAFAPGEHTVDALLFRDGIEAETLHTTYTPGPDETIPDAGSTAAMVAIGCGAIGLYRRRLN